MRAVRKGDRVTGRLLTGREVADLYRVSPETVRRWHRAGKLPSVRTPGGAIRFREDDLDERLAARATGADTLVTTDGRAALMTPPARPGPPRRP